MKKQMLMVLIVVGMLFGVGNVVAEIKLDKWEGFRDLKWGVDIKDVNDPNMIEFERSKNGRVICYSRKTDKLGIGGADLKKITYIFYKGEFCYVAVEAKGSLNFTPLKDAIFSYYGEGHQPNKYIKTWHWFKTHTDGKVCLMLKYNEFSEVTNFSLIYTPITDQQQKDNAQDAEDGKGDF